MNSQIYMDHAATTPVRREVVNAMLSFFTDRFGNPSSPYREGMEARQAIDRARSQVAELLDASPEEIYFTGCGTEADNWALVGAAEAGRRRGRHIITSSVEHHAVLNTCRYLEQRGFRVTYLPVDGEGVVSVEYLRRALRRDTILVSIMTANNEVGSIQPIAQLAEAAHERGALFHTDAVQAFGHIPLSVEEPQVDLLSASGHKFGGPKGVGFLYIRNGVPLESFLHGGGQERGRRAGTENVAEIVGMGEAARLSAIRMEERAVHVGQLRNYLIRRMRREIPLCRLNGSQENRLPGNASFCFAFIDGSALVRRLGADGICASGASACTAGSGQPSHVLLAMGLPGELAAGSLRLTLGEENTRAQIDRVVERIAVHVAELRSLSSAYEEFRQGRVHRGILRYFPGNG